MRPFFLIYFFLLLLFYFFIIIFFAPIFTNFKYYCHAKICINKAWNINLIQSHENSDAFGQICFCDNPTIDYTREGLSLLLIGTTEIMNLRNFYGFSGESNKT